MARPSPAASRLISILNFCAEHPQALTAAQICKSLKMNGATGHSLLATLVEANYLHRNPDKSYAMGPGLMALAINTRRNFSPMTIGRLEMRAIADELDVVAAALFREGDDVVLRERAASRSHLGWVTGAGERYSMREAAFPFIAMLPDADLEPLLAGLAEQRPVVDSVRSATQFLKAHGFLAGIHSEDATWRPNVGAMWGSTVRLLGQVEPKETYLLRIITAPVLDADGYLLFAIALYGFTKPVTGAELVSMGERLAQSCRRVTDFSSGRRASADS